MSYDLPRVRRRRIPKGKAQRMDGTFTALWNAADWDYIGLEAQYRTVGRLLEGYVSGLRDIHNLSPHDPKANIDELTRVLGVLRTRRTMARLLIAASGRPIPDYDAYRNYWTRGKDTLTDAH